MQLDPKSPYLSSSPSTAALLGPAASLGMCQVHQISGPLHPSPGWHKSTFQGALPPPAPAPWLQQQLSPCFQPGPATPVSIALIA